MMPLKFRLNLRPLYEAFDGGLAILMANRIGSLWTEGSTSPSKAPTMLNSLDVELKVQFILLVKCGA